MATLSNRLALSALLAAFISSAALALDRQVYQLPSGAGPHDVSPAPEGKVWYTAQPRGALGILDPSTGVVREISLGPKSSPHGVIQGPDGAAWITDSGQNAIVRFDPRSEEVKVWRLPKGSGNADLNTGTFGRDGIYWFTGQSGIYGRLDPRTGDIRIFKAPKGRGPYGITATSEGEVYFVSLAGSYLAKIDQPTGKAQVIEPPTPGQGARRVWADSRGRLWVSEWNSGQLSMHDPKTGEWKAWKVPGERPMPYAVYVDERDIVWVSDFGGNAVHAFDPKTETFSTIPTSEEGADVRQILGRPGEVWLPESGADRLVVIRTQGQG
jgi:virginiamycin B lyase